MARYKLMYYFADDRKEEEELGQRKKTKADIEKWIEDNERVLGIEWRAGFAIKFIGDPAYYVWRWIKNDEEVIP